MDNKHYDLSDHPTDQQALGGRVEPVVSAALCNSCGSIESVSQVSKTYFICFACAVAKGRVMTDAWLGDYCEDDDAH